MCMSGYRQISQERFYDLVSLFGLAVTAIGNVPVDPLYIINQDKSLGTSALSSISYDLFL